MGELFQKSAYKRTPRPSQECPANYDPTAPTSQFVTPPIFTTSSNLSSSDFALGAQTWAQTSVMQCMLWYFVGYHGVNGSWHSACSVFVLRQKLHPGGLKCRQRQTMPAPAWICFLVLCVMSRPVKAGSPHPEEAFQHPFLVIAAAGDVSEHGL